MLSRFFRRFSSVVNISYPELVAEKSLIDKIEQGFGPESNGVITISDVPGFAEKRKALLPLAAKLAHLGPEALKKLEVPSVGWSIGWSHGRENYLNHPDWSKGSFYANPEYDEPIRDGEGYHLNIWPREDLPELEGAFKALGNEICRVGYLLALRIDRYLEYYNLGYVESKYLYALSESKCHVGRMLHYFPKKDVEPWCGWHNDHGAITGLCSA
jgi:hypothetical protein